MLRLQPPWWVVLMRRMLCFIGQIAATILGRSPSLDCWLESHPTVAASIRWQTVVSGNTREFIERAWPEWTAQQKGELTALFQATWNWQRSQGDAYESDADDIPYPPENIAGDAEFDELQAEVHVTDEYAWAMYVRWIALQLVVEIGRFVPWSITDYDEEDLHALFNSTTIMTAHSHLRYRLGSAFPTSPRIVRRRDNIGASVIAPPRYTLAFLQNNNLIGRSKLDSISHFLQWLAEHCEHFSGGLDDFDYITTEEHWQYRGLPPVSRILEGTTHPLHGAAHWTLGCHGTSGLIRHVLRALNLPVHITLVCGHAQAYFSTERLYLTHTDHPYNRVFRSLNRPASDLLVDHTTYVSWFGSGTDNRIEGCDKISEQIRVLVGD